MESGRKGANRVCGRYYMGDEDILIELRRAIDEANRRSLGEGVRTTGDARPTDLLPVLAPDRRREPSLFAMHWGYGTGDRRLVINARSETAADRPMFADGMKNRRCAVPAKGYYEWERAGRERRKYAISAGDGELTFLAGLYRVTGDGPEFVILTREPAERIAFIHDRMPVMLPGDAVRAWLDPGRDAGALLNRAVLDVDFRRAPGEAEQVAMAIIQDD